MGKVISIIQQQDISIRIFIINLERSKERRRVIKKKLNDLDIAHDFYNAVDGKQLPEQEMTTIHSSSAWLMNINCRRKWQPSI